MELVKQIMLYPLKFNVDITKKEIALYVLVCNDLQYILSGKNRVQKSVLHATFISKRFHRHIPVSILLETYSRSQNSCYFWREG